uniref:Uncharacterized protein n=1 Tax=Anguilla anguilla TaxID=7936 RepID=A0A0E9X9R8_ANGAN
MGGMACCKELRSSKLFKAAFYPSLNRYTTRTVRLLLASRLQPMS